MQNIPIVYQKCNCNILMLTVYSSILTVYMYSNRYKFQPVSTFMELHALTLAARSLCALDYTYTILP